MKSACLKLLLVATLATVGAVVGQQSVSALGNVGYFTSNWTCASSPGNPRDCGNKDAYYENDVVPGRPGLSTAVPDFGNNKAAYRDWVIGQYNSADNNRRQAARFIIATMLGSRSMADNISEFRARIDNPDLVMSRFYSSNPSSLGNISYRGLNEKMQLDFFWDGTRPGSAGYVYDFSIGGNRVYVLQQNCGNPVGLPNIPGLPPVTPPPPPENWSLSAGAKVKPFDGKPNFDHIPNGGTINGKVGQSYTWQLWLRNDGPTDMISKGASYIGVREGYSDPSWNNNWSLGRFPSVKNESAKSGSGGYIYGSWFSPGGPPRYETYEIKPSDVGRTLCQRMAAYPRASNNNSWLDSVKACVHVPYDYSLIPFIDTNVDAVESPNQDFNVTSRVQHQYSGTPSKDTDWRIIKLLVDAGTPDPTGSGSGSTNSSPCAHFAGIAGLKACDAAMWQNNPTVFSNPTTTEIRQVTLGSDFDISNRVCYATAVSPPTHDPADGLWRYSALKCVKVIKRPKVQFWGGDVRSGDEIRTGVSVVDNGSGSAGYGSWAEYGLLARNVIQSASGGALASGPAGRASVSSSMPAGYNRLTFANTPGFGNFGPVPATTLPPILVSSTGQVSTSGNVSISDLASGPSAVNRWSSSSGVNITGGEVPAGETIIINTTGTVTISGNITYAPGPYASIKDLPQLVIIAGNIVIQEGVGEVNAWLVANGAPGYISTCEGASLPNWLAGVTGSTCNSELRIHGPVVANHLFLRRTFGSDDGSLHVPAEVLNMRPDVYLWAQGFAGGYNNIKTSHIRELPPRF